ncbi:Bifunctional protein GlmU [Polystyrenella longa]|uniref:Bifunctional protein GlmU n=1 Tax=Polystyrenella longa TaxID=2528007 RepID=A0A518CU88_9PLAN|nr:NTP transferase domain-containing protein [Polystyrenella longa]QDU82768.1 Bifunctional protein GlmU [Polystyrenella longa]
MSDQLAIVLAAGRSTRMKSDLPKVLHEIHGKPMIDYVLDAVRSAGLNKVVVVVGHQAERVQQALSHHDELEFALQTEQLGTGHAVMSCRDQLAAHNGPVVVLAGDTPLLQASSLEGLVKQLVDNNASAVIGSANTENNFGLGRVVRSADGQFERIVEQKDANEAEQQITEINTGCYAFDSQSLLRSLDQLKPENSQSEYYLTDCPGIMQQAGETVLASCLFTIEEAMGVNTQEQLAEVSQAIQPC